MRLLPGLAKTFTSLFLVSSFLFLVSGSAYAEPGPPNPQPCENPLYTDKLTKVVLEPKEHTFVEIGREGDPKILQHTFEVEVDFSKLAAIFASPNSNYLESRFQDETHRKENILSLSSSLFNLFHGPGQKAAPIVITDDLKVKYVNYIYNHPHLPEASFTYTDIEGSGDPKTIYDLVNEFGLPDPPEGDEDRTQWLETWGRYWAKIPTAVNEFYTGIFIFPLVVGDAELEEINKGRCPGREHERKIYFVLPDYFRTTSLGNQLNQLIVPNAAQSSEADFNDNNLLAKNKNPEGAFSKIIAACLKPLTNNPLSKALIKVIKISFNLTNPIKDAFAAVIPPPEKLPEPCPAPIPILPNDKEGIGPFCSLPPFKPGTNDPQLKPGESCENVESPNKLDKGTLVKCTFLAQPFNSTRLIKKPEDARKGGWDKCEEAGTNSSGQPLYKCTLTIRVFPTFYIPWLAPIWNNTTYSDEADKIAVFGEGKTGKEQETGRPGVYTFFKPKSVDFEVFPEGKNLPSEEQGGAEEIRQRFFGAVDCNKEFTRDLALKPKALQEALGIEQICNL